MSENIAQVVLDAPSKERTRPTGLGVVAGVIISIGLLLSAMLVDLTQTKARLTVNDGGKTYRTWISSTHDGYYLRHRGPDQQSSSALIVTQAELNGISPNCQLEWKADERQVIGKVGQSTARISFR